MSEQNSGIPLKRHKERQDPRGILSSEGEMLQIFRSLGTFFDKHLIF
jgi:hypothetical protein